MTDMDQAVCKSKIVLVCAKSSAKKDWIVGSMQRVLKILNTPD